MLFDELSNFILFFLMENELPLDSGRIEIRVVLSVVIPMVSYHREVIGFPLSRSHWFLELTQSLRSI